MRATAALEVLRRFVDLATSGRVDEAVRLTCLDEAARADLEPIVDQAVSTWGTTAPTLRPRLLQPADDGSIEILYTLDSRSVPVAPIDLRARVVDVDGSLRLCDVLYTNVDEMADAFRDERRVLPSWRTLDELVATVQALDLGVLSWTSVSSSQEPSPGDADRNIVRRAVFTFADASSTSGVTATISIVQYDSHPSAAADRSSFDRLLARMSYESFGLAGAAIRGARGGALRSSYLQPAGVGPVWDTIDAQPQVADPLAVSITVGGLAGQADHERSIALARALFEIGA